MKTKQIKVRRGNSSYARAVLALAVAGTFVPSARGDANWVGGTSQDWNTTANWSATPTGNLTVNLSTGNYPILGVNSTITPNDLLIGNGANASGRMDHRAGTLSLANVSTTGTWMLVGRGANTASGEYNLADTSTGGGATTGFGTGSGSLTVGKLWIGGAAFAAGGTGRVRINTTGTITANSTQNFGGANESTATMTLGYGAGSFGAVTMDNGTVNANGELWVGYTGTGNWDQSGGTVNTTAWLAIGRNNGGVGTYTMTGGTVNVATATAGSFATLGSFAGSSGTLNVGGTGTFTVAGNRQMYVGEGGAGTLNVSGTGLVTVNNTADGLRLGRNAGSTGEVNLNGGTIQTMLVSRGAGAGTFNFDGGTLKAGQSTTTFMAGLTNAYVKQNGAVIDTNGFDVTIGQALLTDPFVNGGGLTKKSAGTLTLAGANTFNGPTSVQAGSLAFTTAQSNIGGVSLANNTTLRVGAAGTAATTVTSTDLTFGTNGPTNATFDFNNLNTTAPLVSTGALTANGTVTVALANAGLLGSGSHTLIGYTSQAGTGSFVGGPYTLGPRSSGTLVNNGTNALLLNVTADVPKWTGADSGAWQVGATGANKNWKLVTGGTTTDYIEGDVALFDDTATGTTNVTVGVANVSPTGTTFNNDAKAYTLGGAFGVAGTGPFTKTGAGSLVITNANTYTGATTIGFGATLTLGDGTTGKDGTIAGTSGVTNNGTLAFNRFGASAAAYPISGTGAVTVTGTGTQTLSGANTYTGGTTVSGGGKLSVAANNHLGDNAGPLLLNNGTLITTAGFANTHPITIGAGGGTINVTTNGQLFMNTANTLSGSGTLNVVGGNGTLAVGVGNLRVAQANAFNGPLNISTGGIFEYGVANAIDAASAITIGNEGEFALQGAPATTLPNAITVNGGTNSVLSFQNGLGGDYNGNITLTANAIVGLRDWYNYATVRGGTISGVVSGAGSLTVNSGTGTGGLLTLSNAAGNTYAGGTTLNASRVLAVTNTALGTGPVAINGTNGQLQLAADVNVANAITINGGGSTAQGVIWVPTADATATVSGAISITAAQAAGGHFAANNGTLNVTGKITSTVPVTTRLGTVVFSNTTSSYTALNVLQGTVKLGATNAVPVGATVDLGTSGAALLDLAGFNQTLAGVTKNTNAGTVTNSGAADSTLTTTGTSTFAGVVQDGATNKTALVVNGGGLTLTGTSTHTGGTTVNAGTLTLGVGGGAGAVRGTLTVNAGATATLNATDTLGFNAGTSVTQVNVNGGTVNNAVAGNNGYLASWTLTGGTVTSTGGGSYHFNAGAGLASAASAVTSGFNGPVVIRGANAVLPVAVADGAAAVDLSIAGPISNSPFEPGATG